MAPNDTRKVHTAETIAKELENDVCVKVSGSDIDGIPRGKIITKAKFVKSLEEGFGFCNVAFGWDMLDKTYDESVQVERGYSDLLAKIDLSSFRRIPYENNVPHFLFDFHDPIANSPFKACPRSLLKKAIKDCNDLGFAPLCGVEFEFYNFKETPESINAKNGVNLTALTPGMFGYSLLRPTLNSKFFDEVYHHCLAYGIPIEGFHTETGPGVFEAALEYGDALEIADRAHLFKKAVKQIALKHGIISSFMAKPYADLPGCSGHMHFSLKDIKTGANAFVDDGNEESAGGNEAKAAMKGMSDTMRHFIAGLLEALPSILPLMLPTINSYKRLVENNWAPITVSYGIENRIAAIRLIAPPTCPKSATRLELRVPGADVNAYLGIAGCIAAGVRGIKKKIEPKFPPVQGGDNGVLGERLPRTLKDAVNLMMAPGSVAREVLGDGFVEHFGRTRLHEWKQWETAVTNWEIKRYIETV
ncbi:glutamine synthetase [Fimicolochytrium jonesii]|uniref:glutamine synthetase n=1 Tax=Fimicolochytrium jonesii TaxID=1396493 RepID=UPI0022FDE1A7|nr:glutamine synthetase [Fimicolochytrium jonesii]KAI8818541.1 glutamine synthetase [Fimicolochytrium jonesii]